MIRYFRFSRVTFSLRRIMRFRAAVPRKEQPQRSNEADVVKGERYTRTNSYRSQLANRRSSDSHIEISPRELQYEFWAMWGAKAMGAGGMEAGAGGAAAVASGGRETTSAPGGAASMSSRRRNSQSDAHVMPRKHVYVCRQYAWAPHGHGAVRLSAVAECAPIVAAPAFNCAVGQHRTCVPLRTTTASVGNRPIPSAARSPNLASVLLEFRVCQILQSIFLSDR